MIVVLTKLEVRDPGKVRGLIVPTFGSMFCITKLKSYYTNFWSRTYCQKIKYMDCCHPVAAALLPETLCKVPIPLVLA